MVVLVIGAYYTTTASYALAPDMKLADKPVEQMIEHFAKVYGSDADQLKKVMKCESNGKVVWGDNFHARGVFQYWQPTWDQFSREFGEKLDRESTYDQVKLTSWAFSKGYKNHWTCSRITGIV